MTDKMVAASRIEKGVVEEKAAPKPVERRTRIDTISEGEVVRKSDFSDEEWARLIETGAVVESGEEFLRRPTSKTSEVQRAAADASPDVEPKNDQPPIGEVNRQANESVAREREIRRKVELGSETSMDIATMAPESQRSAVEREVRNAVEEEMSSSADEDAEPGKYDALTVDQLDDILRDRDLPLTGNKAEKIQRLEDDDKNG